MKSGFLERTRIIKLISNRYECYNKAYEKQNVPQQYIKTMLKPVSNRKSVLACNAWLSCGQSRSPARTVFIRDVVSNIKSYGFSTVYSGVKMRTLLVGFILHGYDNSCAQAFRWDRVKVYFQIRMNSHKSLIKVADFFIKIKWTIK